LKKYCALALCLVALPVAAHPGHADAAGFAAGLLHPLTGLDHLLTMLGIGMWSRKQEQPLAMPLTFIGMMALGAAVQLGAAVPESWIAASVLLTGLLLAAVRLPPAGAIMVVAAFALLHGQAHGRELPELASAAGYLLASAALLLLGRALVKVKPRLAGAAIAGVGLCLFAGVA
jgi:urease accessory protein